MASRSWTWKCPCQCRLIRVSRRRSESSPHSLSATSYQIGLCVGWWPHWLILALRKWGPRADEGRVKIQKIYILVIAYMNTGPLVVGIETRSTNPWETRSRKMIICYTTACCENKTWSECRLRYDISKKTNTQHSCSNLLSDLLIGRFERPLAKDVHVLSSKLDTV